MRRGFNLLMAIFMLLLLSGLGVVTLQYARISAKHTADSYIREQAQLFLDSVVEYSIMKIEGYDRSAGCLETLQYDSADGRFHADVDIVHYYLYQGKDNQGKTISCPSGTIVSIQTPDSHGYVMLDVTVTTKEGARVATPVRITRRVLQRP
ncbi:hypothetical protein [Nitratiruptor sp. SB155-2]|uniref:hypothetical protein n=1 Tax=Nitratiruptor sp. (strain SB155-2) TaxID=387092 RepID=UPI0001587284|nr:hypothetical protein [Nitratiruptor sp. SB155-2]BAF70677.1 conserved hypothetical protein [Nitratiruptor sp. SB155-2]